MFYFFYKIRAGISPDPNIYYRTCFLLFHICFLSPLSGGCTDVLISIPFFSPGLMRGLCLNFGSPQKPALCGASTVRLYCGDDRIRAVLFVSCAGYHLPAQARLTFARLSRSSDRICGLFFRAWVSDTAAFAGRQAARI